LRRGRDSKRQAHALCAEIVEIPPSETGAIGVDVTPNPPQPRSPVASVDSPAVALAGAAGALLRAGKVEEVQRILAVLATLLEGAGTPHEAIGAAGATVIRIRR
jgi:hypothetical protein